VEIETDAGGVADEKGAASSRMHALRVGGANPKGKGSSQIDAATSRTGAAVKQEVVVAEEVVADRLPS